MIHRQSVAKLIIAFVVIVLISSSVVGSKGVAGRQYHPLNITEIPVLNYHKVDDAVLALALTPQEFDAQMSYLYDQGFHTITPDQLLDYMRYGKALPDKPILITFDDGYLDNYSNAYGIMKKYGFTATIFIVTNLVGHDSRFMTWDQVREMQQNGFVFGSHTVDHLVLTKLSVDKVQQQLVQSSEEIERQIGTKPRYFAYPTGAYNREVEQLVRDAGYEGAFTIHFGEAGMESDPYAIERIPIFKSGHTFRSFYYRLTAAPLLERLGIIRN